MASTTTTLSVIACYQSRLQTIPISDGQLIFVVDRNKIALDAQNKRTFYHSIETLQTETERTELDSPVEGQFYFVLSTAALWNYSNGHWIQVTSPTPETSYVYIGDDLPTIGDANVLYVNKTKKQISVWDSTTSSYMLVGDVGAESLEYMTKEQIDALFND